MCLWQCYLPPSSKAEVHLLICKLVESGLCIMHGPGGAGPGWMIKANAPIGAPERSERECGMSYTSGERRGAQQATADGILSPKHQNETRMFKGGKEREKCKRQMGVDKKETQSVDEQKEKTDKRVDREIVKKGEREKERKGRPRKTDRKKERAEAHKQGELQSSKNKPLGVPREATRDLDGRGERQSGGKEGRRRTRMKSGA